MEMPGIYCKKNITSHSIEIKSFTKLIGNDEWNCLWIWQF